MNDTAPRTAILAQIETLKTEAKIARCLSAMWREFPESRKQTLREEKKIKAEMEARGIESPGIDFGGSDHSPQVKVYFAKPESKYSRDHVTFYLDKAKRMDGLSRAIYPFHAGAADQLEAEALERDEAIAKREAILETLDEKIAAVRASHAAAKEALAVFREAASAIPWEGQDKLLKELHRGEDFWRIF